ncbi:hypothetical protein SODG_006867 [Sodalis praecaptivus]
MGHGPNPSAPTGSPLLPRLAAASFGLPRHGEMEEDSRRQEQVIARLISALAQVDNDVRIAFDGALGGKAGVLILAGTGSMAWSSRNRPRDPHFRVGGWGEDIGDEGSAYWIGLQAITAVCRHLDGRTDAPTLCQTLGQHFDIVPDQLITWFLVSACNDASALPAWRARWQRWPKRGTSRRKRYCTKPPLSWRPGGGLICPVLRAGATPAGYLTVR